MATENFVQLPAANAPLGLKTATIEKTVGSDIVEMQEMVIADETVAVSSGGAVRVHRGSLQVSSGGLTATAVASGTSADTVIKATPGRLCRVLVTVTNTNPMNIYDNASAGSGTVIGCLPASPTVGNVYDFQMPAANGITVDGHASNPGVTISFM
jgi:hypothetical protein